MVEFLSSIAHVSSFNVYQTSLVFVKGFCLSLLLDTSCRYPVFWSVNQAPRAHSLRKPPFHFSCYHCDRCSHYFNLTREPLSLMICSRHDVRSEKMDTAYHEPNPVNQARGGEGAA